MSTAPSVNRGVSQSGASVTDAAPAVRRFIQAVSAAKLLITVKAEGPKTSRSYDAPQQGGDPDVSVQERGVSLDWLQGMAGCVRLAGVPAEASTGYVVNKLLLPVLRNSCRKPSTYEAIPSHHLGRPEYYVIHAWQGSFQDMVIQLIEKFDPPPLPNYVAGPPADLKLVFLWLDFVASPFNHNLGDHFNTTLVKEAVCGCAKGALLIIDKDLAFINRCWCLLEIFLTAYHLEVAKIHILFPVVMELDLPLRMEVLLAKVDMSLAETSRQEDRVRILGEVKHSVGVKRMHEILKQGLLRAARTTLRWGTTPQLTAYLALLLESGEFSLLNCTMAAMPELAVDEKMLNEIKQIFNIYDADGSGELDKEEFVAALGCAGFKEAEAHDIFDIVNTDGGDGVGIDEFEAW